MTEQYERLGGRKDKTRSSSNPNSILNTSVNSEESGSRVYYRTYKRRWFVLAVLCVLNMSNAMAWITFAAVADSAASYYNITLAGINWLSLVFLIATIPFGFVTTWVLDSYGLRAGLLLGGWLNAIGLAVRYVSSIPYITSKSTEQYNYSFYVVLGGQSICAIAQPFLLFAPTKLAAQWFPDNHRAIANTIGSTSNPVGLLLAFALCPVIVKDSGDIPELLLYFAIPGAVGVLMVTFGVWNSVPPTPPSASAADTHESFLKGIKKIVKNGPYILLCICFGAGFAVFTTVTSIVEEILCARGYDDNFSDLCGALMIGCGMIGAVIAGLIVDKYKKFEEVAKLGFAFTTLSFIVFAVFSHMREQNIVILISLSIFGLFGFAVYPVCLELGVECVYPVSEGTSAGFMAMSGQLQGIALILLNNVFSKPLTHYEMQFQVCNGNSTTNATDVFTNAIKYSPLVSHHTSGTQPKDTTVTVLVYAGFLAFTTIIFLLFFRTQYKRLRAEHFSVADHVLNYSSRNVDTQSRSIYS